MSDKLNDVLCGGIWSRVPPDFNSLADGLFAQSSSVREANKTVLTSDVAALIGNGDADRFYRTEELIVGVSGYPHFDDAGLTAQREQFGLAPSIAAGYRQFGQEFLQRMRGAFAIALVDRRVNRVILAIDRAGICQMHYRLIPGGCVFATDGNCLNALTTATPTIDDQAVYDYLYFHMVPSPGSIFLDQHKLGPGELLISDGNNVERSRYWQAEFVDSNTATRTELESELFDVLRASVKRGTTDDKTGCFLSGGVDSSTIAGLLAEISSPAPTFTIGFDEKGYDETSFARVSAKHFDTSHTEYFVTPRDVVEILPRIAEKYDEPFGNSSVVPTYYCALTAKQNGIDTLLAGDGGDELFAGNTRYVTQLIFGMYDKIPDRLRSHVIEPIFFGIPGAGRMLPTRKVQSYIRQANLPMPDRLETYNHLARATPESVLHSALVERIQLDAPAEAQRAVYNSSTANSMLNRMLELDWKFTLADNDLRKVCAMCDLAGVSVRYPFLDDELVAFSARVPTNMKIRRFRLRDFFKRAMKQFLPGEVLTKSKHGFGLPFGIWTRSHATMRELAYDCLSDIGKRNIINPQYLKQLRDAHQTDHAHYYGEFIWVLMMLELWFRAHHSNYELPPN